MLVNILPPDPARGAGTEPDVEFIIQHNPHPPSQVEILTSQKDMLVNILPTDPARGSGTEPDAEFMAEIHLQGGDEPGILERLCVQLADMSLDITALSCHQAVVTLPGKQEEEKRFTITGMVRASPLGVMGYGGGNHAMGSSPPCEWLEMFAGEAGEGEAVNHYRNGARLQPWSCHVVLTTVWIAINRWRR
jgi:hypothetical protein